MRFSKVVLYEWGSPRLCYMNEVLQGCVIWMRFSKVLLHEWGSPRLCYMIEVLQGCVIWMRYSKVVLHEWGSPRLCYMNEVLQGCVIKCITGLLLYQILTNTVTICLICCHWWIKNMIKHKSTHMKTAKTLEFIEIVKQEGQGQSFILNSKVSSEGTTVNVKMTESYWGLDNFLPIIKRVLMERWKHTRIAMDTQITFFNNS